MSNAYRHEYCPKCSSPLELQKDIAGMDCPYCGASLSIDPNGEVRLAAGTSDASVEKQQDDSFLSSIRSFSRNHPFYAIALSALGLFILYIVISLLFLLIRAVFGALTSHSFWRGIFAFVVVAGSALLVHTVVRALAYLIILIFLIVATVIAVESARSGLQLILFCLIAGAVVGIITIPLIPYMKE